jgi:arylsulfatase A-like enzyme
MGATYRHVVLCPCFWLVLLTACGGSGDPEPGPGAGNTPAARVILITCDTLRADHLGAYGCDRGLTPNLDALAKESRVFEEAYSSASLTGPALSSLLSGRLPDEIGVARGNRSLMPAQVLTLAEAVAEKGIPTAAVVSNWVLRSQPGGAGRVGVEQGFEHFDDRMSERELNRPMYERRADDTSAAAIRWIDGALARGDDRFFLWVHYQDPHGPYTPREDLAARFARTPGGARRLPIGRTHKSKGQIPSYQVLDGERDPEPYLGRYDGEVATFDAGVGLLLDHLRAENLLDDALLVMSADHGESLGEHDYWFGHGEHLYREVVRVPFMVRLPRSVGGVERAGTSAALASHLDFFPSAMEALGLDPGPCLGNSLLRDDPSGERVALSSLGEARRPGRQQSVSDGRWRMLIGLGPPKLFDIRADGAELQDLSGTHPEVMQRLSQAAGALAQRAGPAIQGIDRRMDQVDERAFDGLGYGDDDEDE